METTTDAPLDAVFASPIGRLGICVRDKALSRLLFLEDEASLRRSSSRHVRQIEAKILHYFEKPGRKLLIDIDVEGTPFQREVWRELRRIRSGKTCSYAWLAKRIGSSARAVGGACRRNPVPIIVPCHRVVSSRGLGGFAGASTGRLLDIKRWLLRHEGVEIADE